MKKLLGLFIAPFFALGLWAIVTTAHAERNTAQQVETARSEVNAAEHALARARFALDAVLAMLLQNDGPVIPHSGLPSIPSNFDRSEYLKPAWGHGRVPVSAAPDVVGAFRFLCKHSHFNYDDPVVHPGEPGMSHLHDWSGNTQGDAHSTYESLRKTGESTCNNKLNRSAYITPTLIYEVPEGDADLNQIAGPSGKVAVIAGHQKIYYKRRPDTDPECQRMGTACVGLPRGLRYVFGKNPHRPDNPGPAYWNCEGPGSKGGRYDDFAALAKGCPVNSAIIGIAFSPPCWNGKDLWVPGGRDHMAYPSHGNNGILQCPDTHPYVVPQFTLQNVYDSEGIDLSRLRLSSDDIEGMPPSKAGSTFHSDWFGAWDDETLAKWEENCINLLLNCSGGDLGNGEQLTPMPDFSLKAAPRFVPVLEKR